MKRFLFVLMCAFVSVTAARPAAGEDIALLFTGRTHGMIYHCNCPLEPSGGVTRRATAIKEFAKKKIPYILLDAGDSFAGGVMDQYSQGESLDKARTEYNIRAMEAMEYTCAAVAENELNFGGEFFRTTALSSKVPFVCCNIQAQGIKPFIIKKAGTAVIGVTAIASEGVQKKMPGAVFMAPEQALKGVVDQLRAKECTIVVLVSNLPQDLSLKLAQEIPGIDILILNQPAENNQPLNAKAPLVLVSPWQGRKLGETVLSLAQGKIAQVKITEELLSTTMAEDNDIVKIIPRCFADSNCAAPGQIGTCVAPGQRNAQCSFVVAPKVRLVIVAAKDCRTCNTESMPQGLAAGIPGLIPTKVFYPGAEAEAYIKKFDIRTLPAFLLGKEIEKEKIFEKLKDNLEPAGDYYQIKPAVSGYGYFPLRPAIIDRVDIFLSPSGKGTQVLLENLKEFQPTVHFIAAEENGVFKVGNGISELEEDLRSVCIQKYYPGFFYNYLLCRAADSASSWWDACLEQADNAVIRTCATSEEGRQLLKENIALGSELNITFGPTFLYENKEIFSAVSAPSKEELRKILIRK
jgi:hypothetical protein